MSVTKKRKETPTELDKLIASKSYEMGCLMALRDIWSTGCCHDCNKRKSCEYVPPIGNIVRYNCPFYEGKPSPEHR